MKIPADARIRHYELTYILPASFTTDESAKVHDKIAKLLTKLKGKIVSKEDWGKQSFAYKIKLHGKTFTEGIYTHLIIELDRKHVAQVERELLLDQQLLRYLLVIEQPTPVMSIRQTAPVEEE